MQSMPSMSYLARLASARNHSYIFPRCLCLSQSPMSRAQSTSRAEVVSQFNMPPASAFQVHVIGYVFVSPDFDAPSTPNVVFSVLIVSLIIGSKRSDALCQWFMSQGLMSPSSKVKDSLVTRFLGTLAEVSVAYSFRISNIEYLSKQQAQMSR